MKNNKVRNQVALLAVGLMAAATTQAALVGHWTFDETSGTTAADSAGGGYDGTVLNPVWADGVIGGALELNGTDCEVTGFGDVLATVSNEVTVSFWGAGNPLTSATINGFSGYDTNGTRVINAHTPHAAGHVYWDAGWTVDPTSTNVPPSSIRNRINLGAGAIKGPWHHWVFTKDAVDGYMAIYLDGTLFHDSGTDTWDGTLEGITELFIGSDGGVNSFYDGRIDDFRVYDTELDATAISTLYTDVTQDYAIAHATATPVDGPIPLDVVFDGSISVSSTNIIDYSWDFGDGTTGNGVMVTNMYTVTNVYAVTLTVTDANGNVDSVQLEVVANPAASIVVDYTVESSDFADFPSFSTNDLAEMFYGSSSGTADGDYRTNTDTDHAMLFDGIIIGTNAVDNDEEALVLWDSGSTVTINFDLSINSLGYDITNIVSIAGWKTGSRGRSNQGYGVYVTYVNDTQETLIAPEHWAPNYPGTEYWTRVSLFETNRNVMATGVKSVTFDFTEDANPGGRVMGREIDIFGAPVPVPVIPPTLVYDSDGDTLTWNANGLYLYSVQSNLNLSIGGGWGTFTNVVGTPPQNTIELPAKGQPAEFYRVIVE